MENEEFRFQTPDRRKAWRELALTMSQAAQLTGVSERQIQHWMDRGYLHPPASGSRRVDGAALDLILLIRQARAVGIPLRRAAPMARAHLDRESAEGLGDMFQGAAIDDLRRKLAAARQGIEDVERALDPTATSNGISKERVLIRTPSRVS